MALQKLQSLGTYEEINGGAHRKAASIVGIPSLVRHLGFWNTGEEGLVRKARVKIGSTGDRAQEKDVASEPPAESNLRIGLPGFVRQSAYRRYVDNLTRLIASDSRPDLEPDVESLVTGLDDQIETGTVTLIRFWWQALRTTVRLEYHGEYITVTSIIDASVKPRAGEAAGTPGAVRTEVADKLALLKTLYDTGPQDSQDEYHQIGQALQDRVWKQFEESVLDSELDGISILDRAFGEIFLDSRGIVIGSREPAEDELVGHSGRAGTTPQVLRETFQHELPRRRSRESIERRFPGAHWARDSLRRIWPFVECEPYPGECEFTVSGFLHCRAIFITALGPQSAGIEGDEEGWIPIRYYLHSFTDDEWQLGRLIDRINTLGTLRLAATMEIGGLKAVGALVETLAYEIEDGIEFIMIALKKMKDETSGPEEDKDAIVRAENKMLEAGKTYQRINDAVSGDIFHRLERSQSYFERFTTEAVGLREKRIEGFQPYTAFVTRRMSSIFGYIQFLKTRMESIEAQNSALSRHYSSLKITSVTCGIDGLVAKMGQQNDKMGEQEREIAKIQEFGEFALIGALIPYYVGSALTHSLSIKGFLAETVWAVVIVVCSIIALIRVKLQKKKDKEAGVRWWWLRLLFWGYLAIVLAAYAGAQYKRFDIDHEQLSAAAAASFDKAADH